MNKLELIELKTEDVKCDFASLVPRIVIIMKLESPAFCYAMVDLINLALLSFNKRYILKYCVFIIQALILLR